MMFTERCVVACITTRSLKFQRRVASAALEAQDRVVAAEREGYDGVYASISQSMLDN